jgi:hypothetical protein
MPKEEKPRIHFETDKEHDAKIQRLMSEKGWSLRETMHYFMDGKVEETCACEGCDWYDGFDSKRDLPRCLNPSPTIDKRFLSRTSGQICRKMQEELIQLQSALGQKTSWKRIQKSQHIDVAIAMAKRYASAQELATHAQGDADFLRREVDELKVRNKPYIEIAQKYAELRTVLPPLNEINGNKLYIAADQVKEFLSTLEKIFGY